MPVGQNPREISDEVSSGKTSDGVNSTMRHFKVRGQPADLKRAKVIPTSLIFDGDRPRGIKWQPIINQST